MGAETSCQKDIGCCKRDSRGGGNEIVRARPSESPGLFTGDKLKSQEEQPEADPPSDKTVFGGGRAKDGVEGLVPWPGGAEAAAPALTNHLETYEDGSTFEGQSLEGKRHGRGVWRSDHESYEGEWKNDCRHGAGRQTWEDGRLYEGQFARGKFHGQGRMEWYTPQGVMIFEGQYENDLKQGKGKYCWPDGRIYDGEWGNGKRRGEAMYTNKSGEKRRGIWNDDKLERWLTSTETGQESNP